MKTSLPDGAFDTAFVGLVMHFTEPDRTPAEMRRILKPGGALIIANVDLLALGVLARVRCLIRVLYHGFTGYRMRPPKGFEPVEGGGDAMANVEQIETALGSPVAPRLLHGLDASAWELVALAAARGYDTRTGLEDALRLPDGSIAANNAALVAAARRIIATSPRS